jgi:all-trans-retinol 13,14-reductase
MDYDAIVIGSGAGGLAAAVALAKAGERVLVLEQHYLPGGWCHSFPLDGYKFSPGVHYIGELQDGGRVRGIYEGLGVANDMVFLELNPEGYDRVRIGDRRFDIPKGADRLTERLQAEFPDESAGIEQYMKVMSGVAHEVQTMRFAKSLRDKVTMPARMPNFFRYGMRSLETVVNKFVDDPVLQAILTIQAGDHGLPASRVPSLMHALIIDHYHNGGYYPKGGGMAIPRAFIKALKRHGGELKVRAKVESLLMEGTGRNRRVTGVRLEDGTEISAKVVISNADPHVTFGQLMKPEDVPRKLQKRLDKTRYSLSSLSLFFAVDMDLRAAGVDSGNIWYSTSPDIEPMYDLATAPDLDQVTSLPGCFLTATTLKDPSARTDGIHTCESFAFVSNEAFKKWEHSHQDDRPQAYEDLKSRMTDLMFERIDELVPGIRDHVVFDALGTPLTNKYYVNATEGNLYGIEKTMDQIGPFGFPIDPPVNGLYLCGASTEGHGVAGATISGLNVAAKVLGCRKSELLGERGQSLRIYPCDHPEEWPADLQPRQRKPEPQVA